jgi:hypothetical protein
VAVGVGDGEGNERAKMRGRRIRAMMWSMAGKVRWVEEGELDVQQL